MKNLLLAFFCFQWSISPAQQNLSGSVKDSKTQESIPFCAVGIKNTAKGCLTNEDGMFQLSSILPTDTLVVDCIGYKQKFVPVSDFVKHPVVFIDQKEKLLDEVVVYGNDEFLYETLKKCRERLLHAEKTESRAYFVLKSELDTKPAEILECYYNAQFDAAGITALNFKNGRIGLAPHDGRYFISLNTSKAISFLNLINENKYLPTVPLQLDKKTLKKRFRLTLKSVYDTLHPVYRIEFTPRKLDGKAFSGELWVEKNTGVLKKIVLTVSETTHHPFLPVFKDFGEIKCVSMQIEKVYTGEGNENRPSHIDFDYQIHYRHIHNPMALNENRDTNFIVSSKGVLHFYDYGKLFYIPPIEYNTEITDYRKITTLSYNEAFWTNNEGLVYSDKMKQSIAYFKKNGQLINYKSTKPKGLYKNAFFENNNIAWNDTLRLSLKESEIKNDTLNGTESFRALAYQLKAQIFFDINKVGDTLQHYSCAIFNIFDSYYNLKTEPYTNCFLNIYFDLFEIERRKLEKEITGKKYSISQMDSVYKLCVARVKERSDLYLKEVERGKNYKALSKWNTYVKAELGVDNIYQLGLLEK